MARFRGGSTVSFKKKKQGKSMLENYTETLDIDAFVEKVKHCGAKYITQATVYTEDGVEMKTTIIKSENKKWKELSTAWKK